jgi:hypothetical protein
MQADARRGRVKPRKTIAKIAGLFQYIIISAPSSPPPPPHLVGTSQGMGSWRENMEWVQGPGSPSFGKKPSIEKKKKIHLELSLKILIKKRKN